VKAKELRELNDAELKTKLSDAHTELFNLRFQQATRQLQNTSRFGQVRDDIARIKMIMRERELRVGA
jgi:large subunit ribosomal protein L29